ncbi:MAG: NERD domain-containing protein [Clostridia bacterium]|nr:NERD domain-containing protein [Clostridia bacterium]MBQ4098679.1 NERD domain-containing protein [Clostridia bacterium]
MPFLIAGIFLIFIIIVFLLIRTKSPESRGVVGESRVKTILGQTIEGKKYVINNLVLNNGSTTSQIDHVLINQKGVFVLETKNYSGEIFGSLNQREWTQVLAYGGVKNKIYNPLKQNATHVYCVKKIVGSLPVISAVVFVQNNTENVQAPNVIKLIELRQFLESGPTVLTVEQMQEAYQKLMSAKVDISTSEHVNNIKQQQKGIENGICPRCGAKLVLRDGKYGSFWGCSKFPRCKFIKKDQI